MYATRDNLFQRHRPESLLYTVDDEGIGEWHPAAEGRVDEALQDATDEIDSYVGQRYVLPVSPAPRRLKQLCIDIAAYNLFTRRGFNADSVDGVLQTRYDKAIEWLRMLAKGGVSLPAQYSEIGIGSGTVDDGTVDAGSEPEIRSAEQVFGRDKLKGW